MAASAGRAEKDWLMDETTGDGNQAVPAVSHFSLQAEKRMRTPHQKISVRGSHYTVMSNHVSYDIN